MSQTKNYYAILGIEKYASQKEITTAYRKLAKKYHPDTNPGSDERFKEISLAYDTLSDPEKRAAYDASQNPFLGANPYGGYTTKAPRPPSRSPFKTKADPSDVAFGDIFADLFSTTQQAPQFARGADITTSLTLTFKEAVFGVTKKLELSTTAVCETCNGFSSPQHPCPTCNGLGTTPRTRAITTKIPAGVNNGQVIRLAGRGGFGAPDGDLLITITLTETNDLSLVGKDIHKSIEISYPEAALGAKKTITLFGESITVKIPPGTQPRATLRVKDKGARGTPPGDLLLSIKITVPKNPSQRATKLLSELAELPKEELR